MSFLPLIEYLHTSDEGGGSTTVNVIAKEIAITEVTATVTHSVSVVTTSLEISITPVVAIITHSVSVTAIPKEVAISGVVASVTHSVTVTGISHEITINPVLASVTGTQYQEPTVYFGEKNLFLTPELWIPRKKPTGPIRINWDNPITDGLIGYFPLQHGPINLCDGSMGTTHNGLLFNNNRANYKDSPSNSYMKAGKLLDRITGECTLAGKIKYTSGGQFRGLLSNIGFCCSSGMYGHGLHVHHISKYVTYAIAEDPTYYTGPLCYLTEGKVEFVAGGLKSNGNKYVYCTSDGYKVDAASTPTSISDGTYDTAIGSTGYNPYTYRFNDDVYWVALWERALSKEELLEIERDEYQLIEANF